MTVLTAVRGDSGDVFPSILELYVPTGSRVADVTYGKGVFWKNVDTSKYDLHPTDLTTGVDFRRLPYEDRCFDCLVLDPPYMHGGATVKKSINDCYRNEVFGHESVVRLYAGGILEAARVLKQGGAIIVKTQDETESGRQRLTHVEIIQLLELLGYTILDVFVLVGEAAPVMRHGYQKSARKNHSYFIVARLRR